MTAASKFSMSALLFYSILGLIWLLAPDVLQHHPIPWSMLTLLITNALVWVRSRQQIEIMGVLPQLAILMLWCMPALHYWLVEYRPGIMEIPMAVNPEVYFRVAVPGVLSLCWAYFLPLPLIPNPSSVRSNLNIAIQQVGSRSSTMVALASLCLFGCYVAPLILPVWMIFLGTICHASLYILVLVAVFNPTLPGRNGWLAGLALFLLLEVIRTTMFGELISVLAVIVLYGAFLRKWTVGKMLAIQFGFALLLYWLISFKYEYRRFAMENRHYTARMAYFIQSATIPFNNPVTPKIVDVVISRLNQGYIMSLALQYVPAYQPFVNGETISSAVKGALLPRLLWPDKPTAGGVDHIRRFMGIKNLPYSINLGVVGEAYVNYGIGAGFGFFLGVYVLVFRIILLLVVRQSNSFPFLLLLLPSLFFIVNFVEKDVAMMLNHVIKQVILLVAVGLMFKLRQLNAGNQAIL